MSELIFKCKELKLSSDGTMPGTTLILDGTPVGRLCRIFFEADAVKENQVLAVVEVSDEHDNVNPPQVITFH